MNTEARNGIYLDEIQKTEGFVCMYLKERREIRLQRGYGLR